MLVVPGEFAYITTALPYLAEIVVVLLVWPNEHDTLHLQLGKNRNITMGPKHINYH